jgi:hypothetical protein
MVNLVRANRTHYRLVKSLPLFHKLTPQQRQEILLCSDPSAVQLLFSRTKCAALTIYAPPFVPEKLKAALTTRRPRRPAGWSNSFPATSTHLEPAVVQRWTKNKIVKANYSSTSDKAMGESGTLDDQRGGISSAAETDAGQAGGKTGYVFRL